MTRWPEGRGNSASPAKSRTHHVQESYCIFSVSASQGTSQVSERNTRALSETPIIGGLDCTGYYPIGGLSSSMNIYQKDIHIYIYKLVDYHHPYLEYI